MEMNNLTYELSSDKKYWYTTDVNSVQWRYPTFPAGVWGDPIPSGEWAVPGRTYDWEYIEPIEPSMKPFQTISKKLEIPIDIEGIKERLREEIFLEVREYIDRVVPAIVLMLQDRWISILGKAKKYSDGVFCYNCGAPIPRGMEEELCSYCGN
jgi:hypothetical protein